MYRGPILPLQGKYLFGDFISERIWSIEHDGTSVTEFIDWTSALVPDVGTIGSISSFGEDAAGNIYIVDLGGEVFRLSPVCTLELTLTHDAGGLTMDFVLGSEVPTTWSTWLLAAGNVWFWWAVPLPELPETSFPVAVPGFPPIGIIGVLTLLSTVDGAICVDLDIVDTGLSQ